MTRWSLAVVAACAPWVGTVRTIAHAQVAVQPAEVGRARFVGFVSPSIMGSVDVGFGMVLPDGDWLAQVGGALARLTADGGVRWARTGVAVSAAVVGPPGEVVAVAKIRDPAALDGARRALIGIDAATGHVRWEATDKPLDGDATAGLARAGAVTVAATSGGEVAVDDSGRVRWSRRATQSSDDPMIATAGADVVVAGTRSLSTSDFATEPLHVSMVIRTLDAATGAERGRTDLPAAGDHFQLEQIAVAADHRIAIRAADVRFHSTMVESADHQTIQNITQDAVEELVVIDGAARVIALPMPVDAPLGPLASGEVAFVDRYATGTAKLGVTTIDLSSGRARRAVVMRPEHVAVGEGVDSFVQVIQFASDGAHLTFAGVFAGTVEPLRAQVREIDSCVAQGHIECSEGRGKTTLAPFAGFIGTVELK